MQNTSYICGGLNLTLSTSPIRTRHVKLRKGNLTHWSYHWTFPSWSYPSHAIQSTFVLSSYPCSSHPSDFGMSLYSVKLYLRKPHRINPGRKTGVGKRMGEYTGANGRELYVSQYLPQLGCRWWQGRILERIFWTSVVHSPVQRSSNHKSGGGRQSVLRIAAMLSVPSKVRKLDGTTNNE